jgi:hypothetical protein
LKASFLGSILLWKVVVVVVVVLLILSMEAAIARGARRYVRLVQIVMYWWTRCGGRKRNKIMDPSTIYLLTNCRVKFVVLLARKVLGSEKTDGVDKSTLLLLLLLLIVLTVVVVRGTLLR